NITIIDLDINGYRANGMMPIQKSFGKGFIIALPFDVNQTITDIRNERKPFYYPSRKFPNEIVSKINKGEVRKLIVNCLRKLFAKMSLPYVHLWYYPNGYQTAFAFRIDIDFDSEKALNAVYDLEKKTNSRFTYFANTKTQTDFANQKDYQLHCYHHKVFKDYQQNFDNIHTAQQLLGKNNIKPIGFAAPFGSWNKNLQKAMEDCHIHYSSEFSLDYDDLPFYPIIDNRRSTVLQIPIHPICVGRLVHAGLTAEQIFNYYQKYIVKQRQSREPIFLYDHPWRISQFSNVFQQVLAFIKNQPEIWQTTLTEFYFWWQKRLQILDECQWHIDKNQLVVQTQNYVNQAVLHIINTVGQETFLPLHTGIYNLNDLKYQPICFNKITELNCYLKLKSKSTKFKLYFYLTLDKILKLLKI
ncbi:MAG: hypothetical protein ABIK33_05960, partial [candidate division WOR-3 bacterium]